MAGLRLKAETTTDSEFVCLPPEATTSPFHEVTQLEAIEATVFFSCLLHSRSSTSHLDTPGGAVAVIMGLRVAIIGAGKGLHTPYLRRLHGPATDGWQEYRAWRR